MATGEGQSELGTSPHPEGMDILSFFEVQTTGEAASQFGKETMISRS